MDQISKGNDARRKRSLQSYSSDPSGKPTVIDFFRKKAMAVDEVSSEDGGSAASAQSGSEGDEEDEGEEADIDTGKRRKAKGKQKGKKVDKHEGGTGQDEAEVSAAPDTDNVDATDSDAASPPPRPPSPPTYQSRQVLLNKYLEKTDPNYVPVYDNTYETLDTDDCPDCGTEWFLVRGMSTSTAQSHQVGS